MKLSFTTLGCPDWTWERIVDEASRLGYDGVELRGIAGELRLGRCEALREERLEASLAYARERSIAICCLDTSCAFHDEERFVEAIEEGMETIDLAVRMGVSSIRVFGDSIADNGREQEIVARVAYGLQTLGDYAEGKAVQVLFETHGDFSSSDRVQEVLRQTSSPAIGVIWDIHHTIKYGGHESPAETWRKLGGYIRHTHVKDALGARPVLLGEGDLPLPEWIALLHEVGYNGWLSFEWEKHWHPEIEEPELALPAFMDYIRRFL